MKKKLLIYPFIIFFLIFDINIAKTEITGNIIAKVGNRIITSFDLENEIKTQLFITQSKINQTQIDKLKTISIKNLVRHAIKDTEIKKYKIKKYNLNDLNNYLDILAKNLGISQANLKQAFKENNISYESHIEKYKTELLWNTLIFNLYRNQINVNVIEVEDEIKEKVKKSSQIKKFNLSEIEILSNELTDPTLKEVYNKIQLEGFDKTAKKFSMSPSSEKGGALGWVAEDVLSSIYLSELKNVKKGEMTKPIQSTNSLIILRVNDIKVSDTKNLDLDLIKKDIIDAKKQIKLQLFSRTHFSNLENSTLINFL